MSVKPTSTTEDEDPDATARLPMAELEPPPEAASEATSATDVLPVPAVAVGTLELAERLREVEQGLEEQTERARQLDAKLREAGERQAALESTLAEAQARRVALEAELAAARAYAQQQTHLAQEGRAAVIRRHEQDIIELRRTSELRLEALTSWQGFRAVSDSLLAEAEARYALLDTRVSVRAELQGVREDAGPAPPAPSAPAQSGFGTDGNELAALRSEVQALQTGLAAAQERQRDLEHKAEAAAARARHLEAEIHASELMFGEPPRNRARREPADTGNDSLTPAPLGNAPLRVLVRQSESGQVVYPIGRHSTIGRTPDNDIQIDATNVSRRHAVLLTSTEQCILEDLNSTNGVHINGRRIVRQRLNDGDIVTIGKTELRFEELT